MKTCYSAVAIVLWACLRLNALASVLYVDLNNTNPTPPYTNWSTAATNIQNAVDVSTNGDLVLVTNGVYASGGRVVYGSLTNRVVINKAITLQSVNGPATTMIAGHQTPGTTNGNSAVRCVYMTNGTVLAGFTLTNGATRAVTSSSDCAGGGVWCESTGAIVSNCVLAANSAYGYGGGAFSGTLNNCLLVNNSVLSYSGASDFGSGGGARNAILNNCQLTGNSAFYGGGAEGGTLNNCVLSNNVASYGGGTIGSALSYCLIKNNSAVYGGGMHSSTCKNNCLIQNNSASTWGGGAMSGTLNNCDIVGNTAQAGGGVYASTLNNCLVYYNMASNGPNYYVTYYGGVFNYCCTTPLPGGIGNIANEPLVADLAGSDFHLQSNSPCINAGKNSYATNLTDWDGNPRIRGGMVDIGAYEYQNPASFISYAWLQQYGLHTDGSADFVDSDGDGMNNWQEFVAGTNPTNAASILMLNSPSNSALGWNISWQSVNTRTYYLQRATNLTAPPGLSSIQSNLVGQAGTTSYTDATATNGGPYFYRVGVQ